jgi:CHASE3 domain sensor protein
VDVYAAINRLRTANIDNLNLLRGFIESGSMDDLNRYNQGIDYLVSVFNELPARTTISS